jgi:hypothetical protein
MIGEVADRIISCKNVWGLGAMTVCIEGLSNAGKSTFAESLAQEIRTRESYGALVIEGDGFHQGYKTAMRVYEDLIQRVGEGEGVPVDFVDQIWRLGVLEEQVLGGVAGFNSTGGNRGDFDLRGVLTGKQDGTEHLERYIIHPEMIVLVPGMYLRHLDGWDYSVFLDVTPDVSIARKIARDKEMGKDRDPKITAGMVNDIEWPAMVRHNETCDDPSLTVDMNNFDRMVIK